MAGMAKGHAGRGCAGYRWSCRPLLKKPFRQWALVTASCLLVIAALPSCLGRAEIPETYDLRSVRLVVWDALQVRFPGHGDYSEELSRVIKAFCLETGVTVDLRYAERREVLDLLTGAGPSGAAQKPHLVFSGEYPVISGDLQDLSDMIDPEVFVDPAAAYWTRDEKLLGIPAFIHWTGTALKHPEILGRSEEGEGLDAPMVPQPERTAYWTGSTAFLRCVLDTPGVSWDADTVIQYAKWVKDSYGPLHDDPLSSWQYGQVDALYPVNPYLYKWLKVTQAEDIPVTIIPPSTPFGDGRFHYTVPAYLVLCEGGAEKAAAAELGRRLAASLGRWAARTLGCIPALADDMSIFNLESGFDYLERRRIWSSVNDGEACAPLVSEYLRTASLAGALYEPLQRFLSGELTLQSLEGLIYEAFSRHTRP